MYASEEDTARMTDWLLRQGQTIFQLFQFPGGELAHSREMLKLCDIPPNARILSLGCGVGGMEAWWKWLRPDLSFTLLNDSQVQLDRCLCPGRKVLANAEEWMLPTNFYHTILISYLLGHVDIRKVMDRVDGGTPERVVIWDAFDGTERFNREMMYRSPRLEEFHGWPRPIVGGVPLCDFIQKTHPWIAENATPALLIS